MIPRKPMRRIFGLLFERSVMNSPGFCLRRIVRAVNRHTFEISAKGGLMNDVGFISIPARYLLQITSKGEWKTVAYLNDPEEARRTIERIPDLRG